MPSTTMDSTIIGRKVAKLRKQLKISTTELARRVNLSQPQISRLENGKQGFRSETLSRISTALGVTPAYFFIEDAEIVKNVKENDIEVRKKLGKDFLSSIERQYGEIAVTPAFKQTIKRLAQILGREATDAKVLRTLLDKIFSMSNEERENLLNSLAEPAPCEVHETPLE
ncbi:MAG: helix-turn-helix transcriptional regulator [Planctomycetes bacterium]|nr:helix-turn-helix transcriptional regulator [Planctomycetota bacterium]